MTAIRELLSELSPLDNPLITRELRSRMRGPRPFWLLMGFQFVLCTALTVAWGSAHGFDPSRGALATLRTYGHQTFQAIMFTEAVIICFIVPALAAGAFTLERERQTLDMLTLTRLSGLRACFGKAAGPALVGFLLVLTSIPPCLICLLMGGVSPGEIALCFSGLVLFTAFISVLVTAISAAGRSTPNAVFAAEMLGLLLVLTGPFELMSSKATVCSGLTPLSWMIRVLRPEGLAAPLFSGEVAFPIPAVLLIASWSFFLLIQAPARMFPPTPIQTAAKRVAGLFAYLMLLTIMLGGFMDSLVHSRMGGSCIPLGSTTGTGLAAVFGIVTAGTALMAALYANYVAIDDGFRPNASPLRSALGGFRLRTLLFAPGPQVAAAVSAILWLIGPAYVLVGIGLAGEDVRDAGAAYIATALAVEGAIVLLGLLIGLVHGYARPTDLRTAQARATAWLSLYLAYPLLASVVYWVVLAASEHGDVVLSWVSSPSPSAILYLIATAGTTAGRSLCLGIGGEQVAPWAVGSCVLLLVLLGLAVRLGWLAAGVRSNREPAFGLVGAASTADAPGE